MLSSFPVRNVKGNRPGDFTTRFSPEIDLSNKNAGYYLAFNRIISMAFTWTNINSGYANQKIAFSKDGGTNFTDIDFAQGVWDYEDINNYIKEKTKTVDGEALVKIFEGSLKILQDLHEDLCEDLHQDL